MRQLPHPRSTTFRIVLAMALLAWTMLAFGTSSTSGAMASAHVQMTAVNISVHCAGMPQAHAGSHHRSAPTVPDGQGNCCAGGCHCLSVCSAALLVPRAGLGDTPEGAGRVQVRVVAFVFADGAPPPLRPPIA